MADSTREGGVETGFGSRSLASFDRLRAESEGLAHHDASAAAKVAAEILADARSVRSQAGDSPLSGGDAEVHFRLQERLHAAERAALAAQRNGVEALTARLRDDQDAFHEISAAAFGALETSAVALREAQELAAQLRSESSDPVSAQVDLSGDEVTIDLTGPVATVEVHEVREEGEIEDASLVTDDAPSLADERSSIVEALVDGPLVGGDAVSRAASRAADAADDAADDAEVADGFVIEEAKTPDVTETQELSLEPIEDVATPPPLPARKSPDEISAEARSLIARMEADTSGSSARMRMSRLLRRDHKDLRKDEKAVARSGQKSRKARRRAELKIERHRIKASQRELKDAGVDLLHRPAWIGQLAYAVAIGILVVLVLFGIWLILSAS